MAEEGNDGITGDIFDDEIKALTQADGVDKEKIVEQVKGKSGKKAPEPDRPPEGGAKPPDKKPDEKKDVPDPSAILGATLNETFGGHFKSWEEVKNANIPEALKERETLRQENANLKTQLSAKPKTQFVNEDIAKMNEFIRETGIKDVGLFYKLNTTDVANMNDIDALVLQHIIENPALSGKESQVRKYIEKRYNVNPADVESGELTQEELDINAIGVASEGAKAKAKIMELKGKIKMPEPPKEEIPEGGKKKWTPEIEAQQKAEWGRGSSKIVEAFSSIGIPLEGSDKPAINFVIPEESRKEVAKQILDYAVNNQMEVTEENVRAIATMAYSDLILKNWSKINREFLTWARGLTEKEYLEQYHNPSGSKNNDARGGGGDDLSDEAKRKRAFEAEMER